jgi:hypothetical protein
MTHQTAHAWYPVWELDTARRWNNVTYSSYASQLATHGVTSTDNLCDDCRGGSSSREDKERDECDPEQDVRSAKAHYAYKTVKWSLRAHRIGECDNLQLLCLECKVLNKRAHSLFFFTGVVLSFIIFVGLGAKCEPFIFFVSLHFWHSQRF